MASNMTVTSGEVEVFDTTLVLNAAVAYSAGDVLVVPQEIPGVFGPLRARRLRSVVVLDEDDQAQALDLVFLNADATLGTINAAVSITDADARKVLGIVEVAAADYVDLANNQIATKSGLDIPMKAADAASGLWIGAVSRGTGTYTASGIRLKIGFA